MSNPPAPEPQDHRPPADWSPAPLAASDDASYATRGTPAPQTSMSPGTNQLPKVEVEQFAPTRSPWPILAGVAVALIAALIFYSTTLRPSAPSSSASTAPSASQSGQSTSGTPELHQPFVAPGGDPAGSWEVVRQEWDVSGLEVLIRIKVTTGTLPYTLNVIDSSGTVRTSAQGSSRTPALDFQPVSEGQQVEGWVRFGAERGESTIALLIGRTEQLSALPISG